MTIRIKIVFILVVCIITGALHAQDLNGGLKIGDKVPDVSIKKILNYKTSTAKLSDFKGKIVIIDFWASFCVPCIQAMPGLDSLQKEFKNDVVILAVTSQKRKVVERTLNVLPSLKNIGLPYIYEDTVFKELFPYNGVPAEVIIDRNGVLKASTNSADINSETISKLVKDEQVQLTVKKDIINPTESDQPLFMKDIGQKVNYCFIVTNYVQGLKGAAGLSSENDGRPPYNRFTATNLMLIDAFRTALLKHLGNMEMLPDSRVELHVKEKWRLLEPPNLSSLEDDAWDRKNCFCFDFMIPQNESLHFFDYFKTELERSFHYKSTLVKKNIPCYVVKCIDSTKFKTTSKNHLLDLSKSRWTFNSIDIDFLFGQINLHTDIPIVNETGYYKRMNFSLIPHFKDFDSLKKQFQAYGMDIVKARRKLDILVISDAKE